MKNFQKLTIRNFCVLLLLVMAISVIASAQRLPNDIRPGAVVVFPYYTSNSDGSANTQLSLYNVNGTSTNVLLIFIDGTFCMESNTFVSLTPNAAISFSSYDFDPISAGYLIAVAVDNSGCVRPAGLTGNAFIKAPAGYFGPGTGEVRGNYGAVTFQAYTNICPVGGALTLNFDGVSLDAMPTSFAAEIQSPNDAPGQTIVMAGLKGNIFNGTIRGATSTVGLACNQNESCGSFQTLLAGNCLAIATIGGAIPRVPFGINNLIPTGAVGTLKFNTEGSAGILITPRNNKGWSGIRTLTYTRTSSVSLVVPSF